MSILQTNINQINYSSIAKVGKQFRDLNIDSSEVGNAVGYALELSETKAYRLARGILSSVDTIDIFEKESKNLINWAKSSSSKERKIIAKVIRRDKGFEGDVFLVHNISTMSKNEARAFMKDYFKSGGDTKAIVEWLAMAGDVLKKLQNGEPLVTRELGSWLKKNVVDNVINGAEALAEGVATIGDALAKAGKSLVDAIGSVLKWTVDKIENFITSLIEEGKSIGDILKAALEKGSDAMRKFMEVIIKMGKTVAEVLQSTFEIMADNISNVLKALIDTGKKIADIVQSVLDTAADMLGSVLKGLMDIGNSIGDILKSVINLTASLLSSVLEGLLELGKSISDIITSLYHVASSLIKDVVQTLIEMGKSIVNIIQETIDLTMDVFKSVVSALMKLGKSITYLLEQAISAVANGIKFMIEAFVLLGVQIVDIVSWAINKTTTLLKEVLNALIQAGKTIIDILATVATKAINIVKKVVEVCISLGKKVVDIIKSAITLGIEFTKNIITIITESTTTLLRFASEVVKLTYRTVASFVKNLLDVGVSILEVLGTVVGSGYLVFRRIINGIIQYMGPVGEILDWVLTQAEDAVSNLWHDALLAIRYAKGKLTDAINWAVTKGDEVMKKLLKAWESVEENLIDFYSYAAEIAKNGVNKIFELIGKATVKLENSISYVLNYLEKNYIHGMRDFIKGILEMGYELSLLMVNIVNLTLEAFTEVIKTILEYGVTLGELIIETMKNPEDLLDNLIKAIDEAGKSLRDIYQAVIVDLSEEFIEEITLALHRLKKPVKEMIEAVAEVYTSAIATVISILLNTLGSYRSMTEDEIVEARLIYGDTFDYSTIYFSQESLLNDIIFGIQDWASGNSNSRAFVSNTLVNFDVHDGKITTATMIHELCHVWQYNDIGAFYMSEAIHAQTFGDGYNYGYNDNSNGDGGEDDLLNAVSNNPTLSIREVFELFNREQQAQIIMHYYVRRYKTQPSANYTAWEPFQSLVYA